MVYHNLAEYLQALDRWQNAPARIDKGRGKVFVKGFWVNWGEFLAHNPKPSYEPAPKENRDGTNVPKGVICKKGR